MNTQHRLWKIWNTVSPLYPNVVSVEYFINQDRWDHNIEKCKKKKPKVRKVAELPSLYLSSWTTLNISLIFLNLALWITREMSLTYDDKELQIKINLTEMVHYLIFVGMITQCKMIVNSMFSVIVERYLTYNLGDL